jgi:hypothetical protein
MSDLKIINSKLDQVIDMLTPKEKVIPEQITVKQLCELFGKSITWHTKLRAEYSELHELGVKKGKFIIYDSHNVICYLNELGYEIKS